MIIVVAAVLWVLLKVPRLPGSADAAPESAPPIEHSIAACDRSRTSSRSRARSGFDWRIDVGLIGSFGAREVMVGTMGVIFGIEDASDDPALCRRRIRDAKPARRIPGLLDAHSPRAPRVLRLRMPVHEHRRRHPTRDEDVALAHLRARLHLRVAYVAALLVYQVGGILHLG